MALVPAENRGYRELFLTSRQAIRRLEKLAESFEGTPAAAALRNGADSLERMLEEVRPLLAAHDLFAGPAAEGNGAGIGAFRAAVVDRFLERNQALRLAVHDLDHEVTLLAYLAAVSESRGDGQLPETCRSWERRLRRRLADVRRAAVELGTNPAYAVEPVDRSKAGRAAHRVGWIVGSVGEWTDRRVGRRRRG
jgi:hypothetical protein